MILEFWNFRFGKLFWKTFREKYKIHQIKILKATNGQKFKLISSQKSKSRDNNTKLKSHIFQKTFRKTQRKSQHIESANFSKKKVYFCQTCFETRKKLVEKLKVMILICFVNRFFMWFVAFSAYMFFPADACLERERSLQFPYQSLKSKMEISYYKLYLLFFQFPQWLNFKLILKKGLTWENSIKNCYPKIDDTHTDFPKEISGLNLNWDEGFPFKLLVT